MEIQIASFQLAEKEPDMLWPLPTFMIRSFPQASSGIHWTVSFLGLHDLHKIRFCRTVQLSDKWEVEINRF